MNALQHSRLYPDRLLANHNQGPRPLPAVLLASRGRAVPMPDHEWHSIKMSVVSERTPDKSWISYHEYDDGPVVRLASSGGDASVDARSGIREVNECKEEHFCALPVEPLSVGRS